MKKVIIRYFIVGSRPVKHINIEDDVYLGSAYAFDWNDGSFKSHDDYLDNIWGRPYKDDAEEIGQAEFENIVNSYRLERGLPAPDDTEFANGLRYYTDILAKD